ncbi:hypothetical protein TD95_004431 [Thielaviopsis punctulata]|uniref:BZIP domain-containing protein n=1 Tax=Thielaviopsis punctulata TaxID=72032 RepID=A0A0F4ZGA4_9PEZI|nr:hypothetical protein TD95_004431 [Thielaviopsis punctulata]
MSTAIPTIKFENSPAESTMSLPGEVYSPLFPQSSTELPTPGQDSADPMESFTPASDEDERPPEDVVLAALAASLSAGDIASAVAASSSTTSGDVSGSEKKPVKKRKSWGQVLPEPKTNLPPRKRAKTADEKEQRRVERVLRNRRAAQSSRERKRLEVEALERRNKELETRITLVERANMILLEELNKARKTDGGSTPASSVLDTIASDSNIMLTSGLFNSHDALSELLSAKNNSDNNNNNDTSSTSTVDPASLSPPLAPVDISSKTASTSKEQKQQKVEPLTPVSTVPVPTKPTDMTQRPAEMFVFGAAFNLQETIDTDRFVLENGFPSSPDTIDIDCHSLVGDASLYTDIYNINDFVFLDQGSTLDPVVHGSGLAADTELAPSLARPLQDATMAALRLVTKNVTDSQFLKPESPSSDVQREDLLNRSTNWVEGAPLPSRETLLTLLWVLRLEEKKLKRNQAVKAASPESQSRRELLVLTNNTTPTTSML